MSRHQSRGASTPRPILLLILGFEGSDDWYIATPPAEPLTHPDRAGRFFITPVSIWIDPSVTEEQVRSLDSYLHTIGFNQEVSVS